MPKIAALLFLMFFPLAAHAQTPVSAPEAPSAEASIEELVQILQNDETRALLIERLQQTAGEGEAGALEAETDLSLVRQLSQYTQKAARSTAETFDSLGRIFRDIGRGLSTTEGDEVRVFLDLAANLVLVGTALFGALLLLRVLAVLAEKQIAHRVEGRRLPLRVVGGVGATLVDALSIVLAWATGYLITLFFVGPSSIRIEPGHALLLNAFLLVELAKVIARFVLSPRFGALRLIPVTDENARYWYFWLSRIVSLIGYTFLFVSPLVAANLDRGLASAVQVVVMTTAVIIGIVVVLQNKDDVRLWLRELAARRHNDGYGQVLLLIGRYWHVFAIVYLLSLLIVWFANPNQALPFMIGATVQSLVAVLAGTLLFRFIASFVTRDLHVPGEIKERLPLLETRLQTFVPTVMHVVRWAILVAVVLAVLQAWRLFNFVGWISSSNGQAAAGAIFSAVLIVVIAFAVHVAVSSWIEYRLNPDFGKVPSAREKTLLGLFKNAFTIALAVFGIMLTLAQIGVNIAPLLAGAGVIGLAIGFGAQKLVEDIINGVFIQLENIMNEGDVVAVGDKSGVVEKLTIRSVTIRDMTGTVHLIPFSSVAQVSNMVRGFSFHVAEIGVAYESDIEAVKTAMKDAFALLMQTEHKDDILDELDMQGIIAFADSAITVRARIKTLPGKHWGAGRAYSEILKRVFDERGIEIPYPHVTYVAGSNSKPGQPGLLAPVPAT
ncbi:mechanosensitive ion channel domain-containing protein [Devosia submarina]|uniref:mechanosensitive ion channel domain-containing protein n=1 Tax=Devosia submarina TaxID=1173082 RepID=UPI00130054CD|nr:mechanosensitive ion channel domain-containing protein [Devosia submarina]